LIGYRQQRHKYKLGFDVQAICEAASRLAMRFVSAKTEAQQPLLVLHRLCESLIRDRIKAVQMHGLHKHGDYFTLPLIRHSRRI